MPSKTKTTESDFLRGIAESLKQVVRQPDINFYQPHEKQQAFHSSDAFGRLFIGGNRSGKTWSGGAEGTFNATGKHPYKTLKWDPPIRGRVVTTDFLHGLPQIIMPVLKMWIPKAELRGNSWEKAYDKILRVLHFKNGSTIQFSSHEQELDKFAGDSLHWIWFDEEPPKHIFTECMMRLIDTDGYWWMTMTPVDGMTWTLDEIYEKNNENIFKVEVDMDDNPYLNEQAKQRAFDLLSPEERKARKEGKYVSLGGMIYPEFSKEKHVIPMWTPPMAEDTPWKLWVASMDHGTTNPTAWLWCAINKEGVKVIWDEYYQDGFERVVSDHAKAVHKINIQHGRPPDYNVGDPSIKHRDPIVQSSIQIEYVTNGIPIVLGNNDVRAGIIMVKEAFRANKLFITENCPNLIWELGRYRWAVWKERKALYEKNKKEEPQKKDDHACDALRYLIASRPEVDDGSFVPHIDVPLESSNALMAGEPVYDENEDEDQFGHRDQHLGVEY